MPLVTNQLVLVSKSTPSDRHADIDEGTEAEPSPQSPAPAPALVPTKQKRKRRKRLKQKRQQPTWWSARIVQQQEQARLQPSPLALASEYR
ncbi:hypothetical protein BHYA_0192g00110 [Botrytis hyacinthi]|uniref:Uncharacterized protein n=1 Tax=Botrytis hyacinthi TaxID=278943 RepID=A0A4Z1GLC1_9HELO|nr:hypothetical protein BHYA_0192g00110 [Botrytis hyacinthi]